MIQRFGQKARAGREESRLKVSVMIPTLNAEKQIGGLLDALLRQTLPPAEILVIDSASGDRTAGMVLSYAEGRSRANVRLMRIPRERFNHGGTRQLGAEETEGDVLVYMTQDAQPASEDLLEQLVRPLREDESIAAAYARQLPRPDASPRERLVRAFNYPDQPELHSLEDLPRLGLKTFFLSDVCAAYRRETFEALGGFERDVLSNEDMLFAARAIRAGYRIAYVPEARVIHSHNLSLRQQYARNRVQGYEIARHRELLGPAPASREGLRMLKAVAAGLLREGRILSVVGLAADCAARYLGSRAGAEHAAASGG